MSDLITIPAEDNFETTLSQAWNGAIGDVLVNDVPVSTIASGEKSYIVVNPGQSNMQVARVSSWATTPTKKFVVDSLAVNSGNATAYTQKSHSANSVVRFSNNYQFWKDIQTAVNSKLDSTELGDFTFTDDTIEATGTTMSIKQTGSNFEIRNVAGKMTFSDDETADVTLKTLTEGASADQYVAVSENDTTVGHLGQKLTAGDGLKKTIIDPAGNEVLDIDIDVADTTTFVKTSSGAADENKIPVLDAVGKVANDFIGSLSTFVFGDGSDGDVTISADTTLVRDMYYNNLTINSGKTLSPNGYKIFVKGTLTNNGTIRYNGANGGDGTADGHNAPGGIGGVASNPSLLSNAQVSGTNGGIGGDVDVGGGVPPVVTSYYATYSTNNGANGGGVNGIGVTGGVSYRGPNYNKLFDMNNMIFSMLGMGSYQPIAYKISGQAAGGLGYGYNPGVTYTCGSGGGAGCSGGLIWIAANIFINNGTIIATGGNGGAGIAGQDGRDGGGGGGGHGGFLFQVTHTLTTQGTVTLTGGTGGAGGAIATAGANGGNGSIISITV